MALYKFAFNFNLSLLVCLQSYTEVYDLLKDPFQLTNIRDSADPTLLLELNKRLLQLSVCSGVTCHVLDSPRPYSPQFNRQFVFFIALFCAVGVFSFSFVLAYCVSKRRRSRTTLHTYSLVPSNVSRQ